MAGVNRLRTIATRLFDIRWVEREELEQYRSRAQELAFFIRQGWARMSKASPPGLLRRKERGHAVAGRGAQTRRAGVPWGARYILWYFALGGWSHSCLPFKLNHHACWPLRSSRLLPCCIGATLAVPGRSALQAGADVDRGQRGSVNYGVGRLSGEYC